MIKLYPVLVTQEKNNSYWAQCRDLPEFNAAGETLEEVIADSVNGIATVAIMYAEQGKSMPTPSKIQAGEYWVSFDPETLISPLTWISVSDELPVPEEQYWIFFTWSDGVTGEAYGIWTGEDWFYDVKENGDLYSRSQAIKDDLDAATVTHYMRIPPTPKMEQSNG